MRIQGVVQMKEKIKNENKTHGAKSLEWEPHLHFFVTFLISFALFTALIVFLLPPTDDPDLIPEILRYAGITAIEVLIITFIQSVIDTFSSDNGGDIPKSFITSARSFGFKKQGKFTDGARDFLLILFCAIIPLDLLTYAIPGILGFISSTDIGLFFKKFSLPLFFILGPVYNLITGVKEEFVFRGYLISNLKREGKNYAAWLISALYFGFMHVNYSYFEISILGPVIWFTTATLIGLLFGGYIIARGKLLVLIFAHGIGNFISSFSIYSYHEAGGLSGASLSGFLMIYYLPMLILGGILALVFRKQIGQGWNKLKELVNEGKDSASMKEGAIIIVMVAILVLSSLFLYI